MDNLNLQAEREEFEVAANAARFFPRELDFTMQKSPSGRRDEYANSHLQSSWEGWLMARRATNATIQQGEDLPPLPWGDDFEAWLEVRSSTEVEQAMREYGAACRASAGAADALDAARWRTCLDHSHNMSDEHGEFIMVQFRRTGVRYPSSEEEFTAAIDAARNTQPGGAPDA